MTHPGNHRERILFTLVMAAAAVGLYFGWRLFWFLTDDAYISFRYISNSILGYGYVWNAPPFLPVEGYTSFLWVVILDGVWRLFGVEPPDSANWISLGFSFATLLVCARMVMNMSWGGRLGRARVAFVAFLMIFLLLNRTFLTWSSSGLETAMFDFFLIAWVYAWVFFKSPQWRAGMGSLLTAFMTLSRPDGLLFTAATIVMIAWLAFLQTDRHTRRKVVLWGVLPLVIPAAHEGWRLWFYGEWLPNTYYAKYTGPWPQMGLRYFLTFAMEYALWFPLLIGVGALAAWRRKRGPIDWWAFAKRHGLLVMAIGTLFGQFFYYTIMIGGDHFEWRVYCQFLPLVFIGFVWMLDRMGAKLATAVAACILFIALSLPVPWTHYFLTKDIQTRKQTLTMAMPITPAWPAWIHWYSKLFDHEQKVLIFHSICIRHQEHKEFWLDQLRLYPTRDEGLKTPRDGFPVRQEVTVGVAAWGLPNVNIIDVLGLNDYVVARTPLRPGKIRAMAHSRTPPDAYWWTYQPNVDIAYDTGRPRIVVRPRKEPMTAEKIRALEFGWRARLDQIQVSPLAK
ncbi:hypothetical protein LLG95_18615 [bacterium]|nr:hypothetical protein [bacterium]